jgi:arylamine N-acetyltransferase
MDHCKLLCTRLTRELSLSIWLTFYYSVHVATIVTIHNQKYLVDTNVGPSASPIPVPMVHDEPSLDVWERQRRMIFEPIPGWAVQTPLWRLQIREPSWDTWMDVIAFEENQWLPIDFKIMINGILGMGLGWFKSRLICYRIEMEDEEPTGYLLMYHDELRRGYKGKFQLLRKLYSEEERLMVLKEDFGVSISDAEARHIVGSVAELKDDGFDFFGNGKL